MATEMVMMTATAMTMKTKAMAAVAAAAWRQCGSSGSLTAAAQRH
jgi:hypothetical protein